MILDELAVHCLQTVVFDFLLKPASRILQPMYVTMIKQHDICSYFCGFGDSPQARANTKILLPRITAQDCSGCFKPWFGQSDEK